MKHVRVVERAGPPPFILYVNLWRGPIFVGIVSYCGRHRQKWTVEDGWVE